MPTNLTDTSSFDTVTGPVGADIRNAAGVRAHLQTLANRTRFLADQTTALANVAALKAISSPANGLVRLVKSIGLYVFDTSSAVTESLPFVVQPTVGTGRWLHEVYAVQGAASGLANLDGTGRLKLSQQPAALADLTALAAITAPSDGDVRHVVGYGHYVFKTSATTGLSPFRVAAADATTGGWVASHAHETSRTRHVPCSRVNGVTSAATSPDVAALFYPLTQADARRDFGQALYVLRASTHATNAWGFVLPIDEFLVHGSTLGSATLAWCPSAGTAGTPTVLAQMDIVRVVRSGAGGGSIGSNTLLTTGFVVDSGGTYNSSTTRQLVYTPDRNNIIDLATYSYAVVIFDAHGTNQVLGNVFHSVALAMTNIPDGRR